MMWCGEAKCLPATGWGLRLTSVAAVSPLTRTSRSISSARCILEATVVEATIVVATAIAASAAGLIAGIGLVAV